MSTNYARSSTTYLLDTSACIGLLRGTAPDLARRLRAIPAEDLRLCSVVKAELYFGARHSASVDGHLELLHEFFQPIPSLAFDDRSAAEYGAIRAGLQAAGMTIGPHDLQIASIARAADLTVLTANVREFVRVPGLRVESARAL